MDITSTNILVSALSSAAMIAAIIYMLTYLLSHYSSKSGTMPLKVVVPSLLYFFGSIIPLYIGTHWLTNLSTTPVNGTPTYLRVAASALGINALLHIICGTLTALFFLRQVIHDLRRGTLRLRA